MKNIRVHIVSEEYMDEDVYADIKLPSIPNIGDTLYIGTDALLLLQAKATFSLNIAQRYCPKWFYGNSCKVTPNELGYENLSDLSFEDAIFVSSVSYKANQNIVEIELTDEKL